MLFFSFIYQDLLDLDAGSLASSCKGGILFLSEANDFWDELEVDRRI